MAYPERSGADAGNAKNGLPSYGAATLARRILWRPCPLRGPFSSGAYGDAR